MKIFQRLTLKQNLFLLQLLALIPWVLGISISLYYIYPHLKVARVQLEAEKHLPPLAELTFLLQKHRGLSYLYLSLAKGEERDFTKKELSKLEERLEKLFAKLNTMHLEDPKAKEVLGDLWRNFESLKIASFQGSVEEIFLKHTILINKTLKFLNEESEAHQLFAEPDLFLRTLAQVAIMELPNFIENLGRISILGSGAIVKGGLTLQEKKLLLSYLEIFSGYKKTLQ